MQFTRISNTLDPLFDECWDIYQSSFPLNERRALDEQHKIMNNDNFICLAIKESNNSIIGILWYWKFKTCIYGEHLAFRKDIQGKGFGKLALDYLKEQATKNNLAIILEIEIPNQNDKNTIRRENFYLREDIKPTSHKHSQPPYHKQDPATPMKIMSWPHPITSNEYQAFYEQQVQIMPKFNI